MVLNLCHRNVDVILNAKMHTVFFNDQSNDGSTPIGVRQSKGRAGSGPWLSLPSIEYWRALFCLTSIAKGPLREQLESGSGVSKNFLLSNKITRALVTWALNAQFYLFCQRKKMVAQSPLSHTFHRNFHDQIIPAEFYLWEMLKHLH